jgi:hypothetical protein
MSRRHGARRRRCTCRTAWSRSGGRRPALTDAAAPGPGLLLHGARRRPPRHGRQPRACRRHRRVDRRRAPGGWSVSSISSPLRPKGRNGLVTAPWSGAPNQSMVGGSPSHSAIKKRGWGPRLAVRGSPRRRTHPTPQTLTDRGSTGAAGSSATAAAETLFVDPAHPVPPPDARPHRT